MKKQILLPAVMFGFAALFLIMFALSAGQAYAVENASYELSDASQVTVEPPPIEVTAIIPHTGGDTATVNITSWIIWVILGVAVLALLIVLIARAATPSHYHE